MATLKTRICKLPRNLADEARSAWKLTGPFYGTQLAIILLLCLIASVLWLDRITGMNADETDTAIQASYILTGQSIDLFTPEQNPRNPFIVLPHLFFHAIFKPSFALVRLPTVCTWLLACGLFYTFLRRQENQQTAIIGLTLSASLPVCIMYARIGWDSSQIVCASIALIIAAWYGRPGWLIATAAAAFLIHPTTLFLQAVATPLFLLRRQELWLKDSKPRWAIVLPTGILGILALLALRAHYATKLTVHYVGDGGHLTHIAEWGQLPWWLIRLFSGHATYRFLSGAGGTPTHTIDLFLLLLTIVAISTLLYKRWKTRDYAIHILFAGAAIAIFAVYMTKGIQAFTPGWERYGLITVPPFIILLSTALATLLKPRQAFAVTVLCGWVFLASLGWHYFYHIHRYNTSTQQTLVTGPEEPKWVAYQDILRDLPPDTTATLYADRWWLEIPLAYLSYRDNRRILVRSLVDWEPPPPGQLTYIATYGLNPPHPEAKAYTKNHTDKRWPVTDQHGITTITIYRLVPTPAAP